MSVTINGNGTVTGLSTGGLRSMQTFTTAGSHTYTKPAGVSRIQVFVTGGGGGGGGSGTTSHFSGGGGGGGGTAIKIIDASAISTVAVTVGAGGNGGAVGFSPGSAGGTSSFGAHCSATGGVGGHPGGSIGGNLAGGVGSGGDLNLKGNASMGGYDNTSWPTVAGSGGGSFWGGAGFGQYAANGNPGEHGGGGGGGNRANVTNRAGGAGGAGLVVVYEYF